MTASRPRVLHVVSTLGTYGAEQLVLQLVRRLSTDVEIGVMTVYSPDAAIAQRQRDSGVPLFDMHRGTRFEATLLPRMVSAMRAFRPDVVHAHTHYGKYWGRVAALCARVPAIVYTEHDNTTEKRRPYQLANAVLHPRTRAFVAFSHGHRDRFARAEHVPIEQISVIPNGIERPTAGPSREAARAVLAIPDDAFVLLRAARLHPSKNHGLAIQAVAQLPEPLRNRVLLLVAGEGSDFEGLRELAASLGVVERVRFLGFRRDVATTLMAASDTCLFTSLWEGMPITLIEAMFAGLPVITTPWDGAREILGDGAFGTVLADFEAATLAHAIVHATANPVRLRATARAAFERAQNAHTISRTAAAHVELYMRALAVGAEGGCGTRSN